MAAWKRRSPATISNRPPRGRTMMGSRMPCLRILSPSVASAASSNRRRGCSGDGTIWSGRSMWTSLSPAGVGCVGSLAKRASSPRPRRLLLFTRFYLLGELPVRLGTGGKRVIFQDGFAIAGRFAHAYAPGDDGSEDSLSKMLDEFILDLCRQDSPLVEHGHQDAQQGEIWVQTLLDQADRSQQVRQSFQCVVLTLDGDNDFVCRC